MYKIAYSLKLLLSICVLASVMLTSSCSTFKWIFCPWCEIDDSLYESGKEFNYAGVVHVKEGMDIQEVLAILGKPYTISTSSVAKQFIWTYSYAGETRTVAIQFTDGKVSAISSNIDKPSNKFGISY